MNPSIFPPLTSTFGVVLPVRSAAVDVGGVVVRRLAAARRHGYAHRWHAIRHRNAVGARVGAEVAVERPVLLFDDDDVLDLVDTRGHEVVARRAAAHPFGGGRRLGGRGAARAERHRQNHEGTSNNGNCLALGTGQRVARASHIRSIGRIERTVN